MTFRLKNLIYKEKMKFMTLYQIDIGYACFGVEVENEIVSYAPPIAKWTIGKTWEEVKLHYTAKKNANITKKRL